MSTFHTFQKRILIGVVLDIEAPTKEEAVMKIAAMDITKAVATLTEGVNAEFFFFPGDFDASMLEEVEEESNDNDNLDTEVWGD